MQEHIYASEKLVNNLNLKQYSQIIFRGVGGYKILDLWQNIPFIRNIAPAVILLEIGSNDLCDYNTTPEYLVDEILKFVNYLKQELSIKAVIVMQVYVRGLNFRPRSFQRNIAE
jgi:hypothetical protein